MTDVFHTGHAVYPGSVHLSSYMECFLPHSCAYWVHCVIRGLAVWLCDCGGYRWLELIFLLAADVMLCFAFVTPPVTSPRCQAIADTSVSRLSLQTSLTPKACKAALNWDLDKTADRG